MPAVADAAKGGAFPVWVLADERPGNVSQCLGVAEALGLPFAVKSLRYNRLAALPNHLLGASRLGLGAATREDLAPPWPRLAIAAGRRTAPVMRWLKRKGVALVQIMDPGPPGREDFDVIFVPGHDGRLAGHPNVVTVTGAPVRITPERLAAEAARWEDRLAAMPHPRIALVVGGATRRRPFAAGLAAELARLVAEQAARQGGSVIATTSRRTGAEAEAAILANLPEPRLIHRWGEPGDNPYPAMLGLADMVVVTGDSVSMVCEACATTAPVYVFAPPGMVSAKHARLHRELYGLGVARPLAGTMENWSHPPLLTARVVAREIERRFAPALAG